MAIFWLTFFLVVKSPHIKSLTSERKFQGQNVHHFLQEDGTPLQYSCLENPNGRRSLVGCSPWGREESDMTERLPFTFHFHALEKEMATHSSVLAWRIQGRGSLVDCRLWGHAESGMTEAT